MRPEPEPQTKREVLQGPALEAAFTELCERRQSLYLATPYLAFESRFIERAEGALRIRATMSRNVVRHTLAQHPLRLRFPWNLTRYGGPVRILDYEDGGASKTLLLSLPPALAPDDQRRGYRLDQVGRSSGTLGSREQALVRYAVENINLWGIGIFCAGPLPSGFQPGRSVDIALALDQGPVIQGTGRVSHGNGQYLGLAFAPPLAGPALDAHTAWLQPRLAEAQRKWDDRANLRTLVDLAVQPKAAPDGVLLVCGDPQFQAGVAAALGETPPLRTVFPAMAPFREAMALQPPHLLLLALTGGLEETHRLRTMLESVPPRCPMVALGIGPDLEVTRTLAAELKATLFLDRRATTTPFFRRLVLGLIRKHWPGSQVV